MKPVFRVLSANEEIIRGGWGHSADEVLEWWITGGHPVKTLVEKE